MEHGVAIETTRTACAGAASAFALKTLAIRAGSYAPGIDERLFFDLSRDASGVDLVRVATWFAARGAELTRLGYRVGVRLVAFRTEAIANWVSAGDGYRAAVLATACQTLHPEAMTVGTSAIALVCGGSGGKPALCVGDPWPGGPSLGSVPAMLAEAHRQVLHRALLLYWSGWS